MVKNPETNLFLKITDQRENKTLINKYMVHFHFKSVIAQTSTHMI